MNSYGVRILRDVGIRLPVRISRSRLVISSKFSHTRAPYKMVR